MEEFEQWQWTQGPDPPRDLPEEFKNRVGELGGTEVTMLIPKTVLKTDLSKQHNQLSMALKQIKKPNFLRKCEFQLLKEGIKVPLNHKPSLQITEIIFSKWDMEKKYGDPNSCCILRHIWMEVVDNNQSKRKMLSKFGLSTLKEGFAWLLLNYH